MVPHKRKVPDSCSPAKSKATKGSSSKGKQPQQAEKERTRSARARAESPELNPIPGPRKSRNILFPRWFDLEDQKLLEFFPEFPAIMEAQGWLNFISAHERYYPKLVQEFYHNLQIVDGKLYTILMDVEIGITRKLLHIALKVLASGADPKTTQFDEREAYSLMTGQPISE